MKNKDKENEWKYFVLFTFIATLITAIYLTNKNAIFFEVRLIIN